jgi:creatinine amidohydrolase
MSVERWGRLTRTRLGELLPDALVVVPLGATEQHGPHLATGTDALMAQTLAERAAERAAPRCGRPIVLAPTLPYGASDHHLPFGATLSLRQDTLVAVLRDLLRSLHDAGAQRVVVLNGHGGNRAACALVAGDAAREHGLTVLGASYWEIADARDVAYGPPPVAAGFVPGHAGWFETSLALALDPRLVHDAPSRPQGTPPLQSIAGATVDAPDSWTRIDGYTDDPSQADADAGARLLEALTAAVADALVEAAA